MPARDEAHLVAVLLPALWLGFVLAISFLEAPLKFRAPGVTREAALSIGRIVFRALARVELALWLVEGLALSVAGWPGAAAAWFGTLTVVLAAQQAWLLPALNQRAVEVLAGRSVSPNRRLHHLYVGGECAKVVVLPALCWSLARAATFAGV